MTEADTIRVARPEEDEGMTKEKRAFYHGMLAVLAVVKDHDQQVLFDEIVASADADELVAVARADEQMEMSGLARYGYGKKAMKIFRAQGIPDSHKIAVYDALCRHFAETLDTYYTTPVPQRPRHDSGAARAEHTECVGIEVLDDGEIGVVMAIQGWADTIGFCVELPALTRDDQTDEGAWIDVAEDTDPAEGQGHD